MTQNQLCGVCELIRKNARDEDPGFNTEINFLDFTQKHGGDTFYISDAVIYFRGTGEEKTIGCGFLECIRMDVRVLIGNYNGTTRAFLETERTGGKYLIAELEEFGMMSTFAVDGCNLGILTVFDKDLGVAHFEVMAGSPCKNHWTRSDIPADAKAPKIAASTSSVLMTQGLSL